MKHQIFHAIGNDRIAVSGAAGTGKTSVAEYLSLEYGIPLLQIPTQKYMAKYSVSSHNEIIQLCNREPKKGIAFHREIAYERAIVFSSTPGPWITDRTPLDSYIYYLIQCSAWDNTIMTLEFWDLVRNSQRFIDKYFIFKANSLPIPETDERRVKNRQFHSMYETLYMEHMRMCDSAWTVLTETDNKAQPISTRAEIILQMIINGQPNKRNQE